MFVERGHGSRIWDVDGTEYVDLHAGFGAMLVGHAPPGHRRRGAATGSPPAPTSPSRCPTSSPSPRELARRFGLPLWRFANSGTEATMAAVHLMRAATGRSQIIKVEGSYHGHHDAVQVSVYPDLDDAGPADRPRSVPEHGAVAAGDRRADPHRAVRRPRRRARGCCSSTPGEIAGMIIEPVMMNIGVIPPPAGYLDGARRCCCTRTARCSRSTR